MSRCYCAFFIFIFGPRCIYSLSISHIDWCLPNRIEAGSKMISLPFCVLFVLVRSRWAVSLSTVGIVLTATVGWIPIVFLYTDGFLRRCCIIDGLLSPRHCLWHCVGMYVGPCISSTYRNNLNDCSCNRGGMIAPILGGILLIMNRLIPVYTSVVIFAIARYC